MLVIMNQMSYTLSKYVLTVKCSKLWQVEDLGTIQSSSHDGIFSQHATCLHV